METENSKKHKGDDLEVTGVSRSGRVRKKSSKLMDFESPDDIDTSRPKRPTQAQRVQTHHHLPPPQISQSDAHIKDDAADELSEEDFYDPTLENPNDSLESDSDDGTNPDDSQLSMDSPVNDAPHTLSRPGNSIYMMEKSNKKKLLVKDGRIIGRAKAQRKDKGKSRVTAYMMWAKNARNELLKKHPDMDFAAISKRLGEMWANVNFLERYVWKRRAKRYVATKTEQGSSKTINSNAGTPKLSTASQNHHNVQTPTTNQQSVQSSRNRQTSTSKTNHNTSGGPTSGAVTNSGGSSGGGSGSSGMYRVVGVGPVEVGAHLRLLGESLTIIGERLKEHEGQIAVSGSVSVLLDTLLCSLAPLVCLTAHIPSIAPPVPLLQETLDNIAYIMPGL